MVMYALAVKPLFGKLKLDVPNVKQVWYADDATGSDACDDLRKFCKQVWYVDDATGAGTCDDLSKFWDSLQEHGARYGYHPNAAKTHLVTKEEYAEKAREIFTGTDINITTERRRHLGAAFGSRSYTEECVVGKVLKWSEEIKQLANIAQTQPHAALCLYHEPFLISQAIQHHLIPTLTGPPPCSSVERDLLALPVCMGGIGIVNPPSMSQHVFEGSVRVTSPLVDAIVTQDQDQKVDIFKVMEVKVSIRQSNHEH